MNKVWKYGKLYLFTFVGMAINPILVGKYFFIGVMILICSLFIRSVGVMISLVGTNLSKKEKKYLKILKKVLKFFKQHPIGKKSIGGYYEN